MGHVHYLAQDAALSLSSEVPYAQALVIRRFTETSNFALLYSFGEPCFRPSACTRKAPSGGVKMDDSGASV
jgi:hypothetical protein